MQDSESTKADIESLRRQLEIHRKSLRRLEEQKALHGDLDAPLRLLHSIDHENEEIRRIEAEIQELREKLQVLEQDMVYSVNSSYYLIEDSELTLVKPAGVLDQLGEPKVAVVKPYNAVVFEQGGNITRVEGPGTFLIERFEFPKHIIDLRPQWESFEVEEVLTKDKVPLHIKCGLGYRIESREQTAERGEDPREMVEGRRFPGIISEEYPVCKRTIFKAAYGPAGDWKITTKGATITKLREVIAEFELQDIYRLDLAEVGRRTKEEVTNIAHHWGVNVGTVNIDTVEALETVRKQVWGTEYLRSEGRDWKATVQVFLSYARQDEEQVEKIYQALSDAGFKPWMDKKDILPGETWRSSIQRAIRRSDFFLTCLSANSVNKRSFLQKEIRHALDIWQEKLDSDIYLIPVRLGDCEVPESLCDFQWVDLFEEDGWAQLMNAIQVGMERREGST